MPDILEFIEEQKSELQDIVKSILNPGSRGGIIVKVLENGEPLYASQVKDVGDVDINNGEVDKRFGRKYSIFSGKPYEAIAHLRIVNEGFVPGAFQRNDIGDIDLVWGNEKYGLCHIITKRESEKYDIDKFLLTLPKIIENGVAKANKNNPAKVDLIHDRPRAIAIISLAKGKEFSPWLLTSFKIRKKAFEKMSDALDYLKSTIAPMSAVPDFCPLEEIYSSFFYDKRSTNYSQEQKSPSITIRKSNITSNPIICDRCLEFEQQIARVFSSEQAMQESGMWDGEDRIVGDPYTDIAVWVGKTNADRGSMSNWWYCAPAHPNCSHEYSSIDPGETQYDTPHSYDPEQDEGIKKIQEQYEENFKKNRILNKLDRERARNMNKSSLGVLMDGLYRNGIYEEKTCGYGHCNHTITDDDDWLQNYIDWRLKDG